MNFLYSKITHHKKLILIVFLCLLHGYNLFEPPLEVQPLPQTWRAQIARNMVRNNFNMLLPEIDSTGSSPGYVRSEFQLYTFLVAILYYFFGTHIFLGRCVSIIFYIISVIILYKLIKHIENKSVAYCSIVVYLLIPLNYIFSQTFLPDPTMNSLALLSLYSFIVYVDNMLDSNKWQWLVVFFITFTCTMLIKMYMIFLLIPMYYYLFSSIKIKNHYYKITLLIIISILINLTWYIYAEYIGRKYIHNSWTSPMYWFNYKLLFSPSFYIDMLNRFVFQIFTPIGLSLFILAFLQRKYKVNTFFIFWLIAFFIFFIVCLNGNYINAYYQLTLTPIISFFIAVAWLSIRPTLKNSTFQKMLLTALLIMLVFIPIIPHFKIPKSKKEMVQSAKILTKQVPEDAYIITFHGTQLFLYFFDRKGWDINISNGLFNVETINKILKYKSLGAEFLIFESQEQLESFTKYLNDYQLVNKIGKYCLIKLK